jgi:ribosomal protein S18 acetylase RimI-like enzyme
VAIEVRAATAADAAACVEIVRGLPEFFTPDVPDKITADMGHHESWVVADGEEVVGFAIVDRRSAEAAEVLWAAVAAGRRGSGLGTRLLEAVMAELAAGAVHLVEVKTLDASAGYGPYEATRGFWRARGFVQVDTIDPLPGWQPGNPAALCVAALAPTR